MKPLSALCAAGLALSPALFAPPGGLVRQEAAPEHAQEPHSPLSEAMEVVEESLGRLRRALRDEGSLEEGLAAVAAMQEATLKAKLLEPPLAALRPEAERAAFVRDYRKMLVQMLEAELAVETALLDGDREAARTRFQALRAFEDQGHERFTEGG